MDIDSNNTLWIVWENKISSPSSIAISMINGHHNANMMGETATDSNFDTGTFPSMNIVKNTLSVAWMKEDNSIKVMSKAVS